jgi:hypothetical protein
MVYQFWLPFAILSILIIFFDRRFGTLRDISSSNPQPYSWARVQLAWWTVIILSSVIAIVWKDIQVAPPGNLPSLHYSTLVLLGISAATTTVARAIDVGDMAGSTITTRHQNLPAENFLTDILSEQNGISIHRLQAVIFNAVFGIWFIGSVVYNLVTGHDPCAGLAAGTQAALDCKQTPLDYIMPVISDNNLILIGLSSATYAAMKTTENKVPATVNAAANTQAITANTNTTLTTEAIAPPTITTTNISTTPAQG